MHTQSNLSIVVKYKKPKPVKRYIKEHQIKNDTGQLKDDS